MGPGAFAGCVLSGLLLTSAYPKPGLWPVIFAGLVPLLAASEKQPLKIAFGCGYIAGLVHYATLLFWLLDVLVIYGHLNIILSIPIFLLMIGYLSLYPALFIIGLHLSDRYLNIKHGSLKWVFTGAALFTGLEYFRGFFLTGFPWEPLGAALAPCPVLIQPADVIGTGGLTFAVAFINLAIFCVYRSIQNKTFKQTGWQQTAAIVIISALMIGYGSMRLDQVSREMDKAEKKKIAVVQASIDQSIKWNPQFRLDTIMLYRDLTHEAARNKPDLIVWPETATPFFYRNNESLTDWLNDFVKKINTPLLFGSPAYETDAGKNKYYNRAYLLNEQAGIVGTYDKVHLVPYGEYVPLQQLFPFIRKITQAIGDYYPGRIGEILELDGDKLGVLICYESIFATLARKQADAGADMLFVITNDAWFGKSSAPYQHFEQAVLRAVETRKAVVRAANTGISGFITPDGRIEGTIDLFEKDTLEKEVPRMVGKTFYTTAGDVLPQVSLGVTVLIFSAAFYRRRKNADRS